MRFGVWIEANAESALKVIWVTAMVSVAVSSPLVFWLLQPARQAVAASMMAVSEAANILFMIADTNMMVERCAQRHTQCYAQILFGDM